MRWRKKARGQAPREKGSQAWAQLGQQDELDSLAYQDVHGDQQLERSEIEAKLSPHSREIASAAVGVLVFISVWVVISFGSMGIAAVKDSLWHSSVPSYSVENRDLTKALHRSVLNEMCYSPALEDGTPDPSDETCYESAKDVPELQWHKNAVAAEKAERDAQMADQPQSALGWIFSLGWIKFFVSAFAGGAAWGALRLVLMRNLKAQNLMRDTTDINQYKNDQHVALPEEVRERFDVVPDVGAHTGVSATTLISHSMVANKGIQPVAFAKRAEQDVLDDDGDVTLFKGEVLTDEQGTPITDMVPMFDEAFGTALWDASGLPDNEKLRRRLDPSTVPYNPGNASRDKLKGFATLADLVNKEWELPVYEPQRPAGVYYVDTAPANTMILAMTRAGKGQTYIEPMLDIWMRQKRPDNMVINDPKGELLVKNYVRATMRGFQVVQFNLINAMKTDIYNPLGMAAEAAREGDQTKCALYVENIADVFFPVDGAEDPVWPNAANNAFKRAAYGLIDYYLEEEHQLRQYAMRHGMDQKVLEQKLDAMWGKVTLYNCYQLFVQLTSKKRKSPMTQMNERLKGGYYDQIQDEDERQEAINHDQAQAERIEFLWEDKPELDLLTLFFNATEALPQSTMRTLIANANNALRAMAGAEKMLASVYGIAITAMSFFTDPTISTLTSGTPSQNTDLGGLSFPRRFGVRFAQNFTKRDGLIGAQAKWDAFDDPELTHNLGKDFEHEDTVVREGWARYYFDGKFPHDVAYLRLRLFNPHTNVLLKTFYFQFTKGYQLSLNGRKFVKDPVTGHKIIRNGVLVEMVKGPDGKLVPGHLNYPTTRLLDKAGKPQTVRESVPAIILSSVRYSEQPKAVFLVTPPHLMKYAKLVLILVKQLVDLNFDKSYMTKSSQKPLYKTRFMLDELGNLQSEGHGIAGFETMLSIGLGQEQQFTLILQTLQQARDVYGDSVDKIIQGNVANIVFLKSTDDTMIETLAKMSGTRHRAVRDSKTVTQDTERLIEGLNVEGKVSYTISAKEESVIGYNDLAFLPERNSIIFSAGISPIWNRNAEILPMSWRLFKDTIQHPGHTYSLQTIPTLSSALEFDVRLNQPDFVKMLDKRIEQAANAAEAMDLYRDAYNLDDYGISILDPDVYSAEVMDLIASIEAERQGQSDESEDYDMMSEDAYRAFVGAGYAVFSQDDSINEDVQQELAMQQKIQDDRAKKRYAEGQISRADFIGDNGSVIHSLDDEIIAAYRDAKHELVRDARFFRVDENGSLCSLEGRVYISQGLSSSELRAIQDASSDNTQGVYGDDQSISDAAELGSWQVHDVFYKFLGNLESWEDLGNGSFDRAIARIHERRENE